MVIGNSSSGLLEAPSFGIPTVNIGDRQRGRILAASVIECDNNTIGIVEGIRKAADHSFMTFCKSVKNPYDNGNASEKIVNILKETPLESIARKKFNDLAF
jgi:UDP-N-acetylglucosamine 2-epimerase